MTKRLYRSRTNRMLGGVCGGLGEYLGIDPTIVRFFFALLALGRGAGVLLYLVMWLIVPREDQVEGASPRDVVHTGSEEMAERARTVGDGLRRASAGSRTSGSVILGAAMVFLGLILLLGGFHIHWLWWLSLAKLWPLLLVAGGIIVLLRGRDVGRHVDA